MTYPGYPLSSITRPLLYRLTCTHNVDLPVQQLGVAATCASLDASESSCTAGVPSPSSLLLPAVSLTVPALTSSLPEVASPSTRITASGSVHEPAASDIVAASPIPRPRGRGATQSSRSYDWPACGSHSRARSPSDNDRNASSLTHSARRGWLSRGSLRNGTTGSPVPHTVVSDTTSALRSRDEDGRVRDGFDHWHSAGSRRSSSHHDSWGASGSAIAPDLSADLGCRVCLHGVSISASYDDLRSMLEQYGTLAALAIQPSRKHASIRTRAYATFSDARSASEASFSLRDSRVGVVVNGRSIFAPDQKHSSHATHPQHTSEVWPGPPRGLRQSNFPARPPSGLSRWDCVGRNTSSCGGRS